MEAPALVWIRLAPPFDPEDPPVALNQMKLFRAEGKSLCVLHLEKGWFAMDDRCPHDGGPLSLGKCTREGKVICPWHHYIFDAESGKSLEPPGYSARTYPVEVRQHGLFVGLPMKKWFFF